MARSKIATFARRRPPYFWWILAHALALCFCVLSWILTLDVFRHPERPRYYEILKKIGREPVPQVVTALEAPQGDSIGPEKIYRNYALYALPANQKKLTKLNTRHLRSYLQNYAETDKPIYIEGYFKVLQVRPLETSDIIFPGFVVRAQAFVLSDKARAPGPYPVLIEYIFPTNNKAAFTWCKPGTELKVKKIPHCAGILHVSHLGTTDEPIINLTVMPLAYGDCEIGENHTLTLEPPTKLNLAAKLPLFPNVVPPSVE